MLIFYVVTYLLLFPTKIGIFGKDNNIYIIFTKISRIWWQTIDFYVLTTWTLVTFIGAKPRWDVLSLCRGEGGADWKLKKFYVII